MPSQIVIEVTVANFPEGWEGTPQEFANELTGLLVFTATGNFLTGQIGGAVPTSDVGLFISGREIQVWSTDLGKYVPTDTVPIGGAIPWFGTGAVPANYLLCDNAEYDQAGDKAELFAVIGTRHQRVGDAGDKFRVPDCRGRVLMGSGEGETGILGDGVGVGLLTERNIGEYTGAEWGTLKQTTQPGAATGRITYQTRPAGSLPNNTTFYSGVTQPSAVCAYIIRYK